ncbi:MAG TPA: hypothetical protein VKP14_10115 [Gaiellaceae bacterium]|nr:hypothetical protein [Gaiellaceae bacterium]
MREPFRECPSFESCSCNVCPLDPRAAEREELPGEDPCGAQRATRERIAAKYPELLPGKGLLPREVARDRRRAQHASRLAAMSPESRAKFEDGQRRLIERNAERRAQSVPDAAFGRAKPDQWMDEGSGSGASAQPKDHGGAVDPAEPVA